MNKINRRTRGRLGGKFRRASSKPDFLFMIKVKNGKTLKKGTGSWKNVTTLLEVGDASLLCGRPKCTLRSVKCEVWSVLHTKLKRCASPKTTLQTFDSTLQSVECGELK